jgi:threonine/homoserine/homoserine lactone efflux protein
MEHLWLYAVLVFGIIVLPGMDMAFVAASSMLDGRRAGLAAVGGIIAGGVVHVAMGTLGLGLLLKLVPGAFNVMLSAGALYIGRMGVLLCRGAGALGEIETGPSRTLAQTFGRATLTCLLNPKAYVFTLAVFPQFIRPEYGPLPQQAAALASITAVAQALVYGAVALGAAGLRGWLRANAGHQIAFARMVGALLLLTSLWTLWHGWQTGDPT